MVTSPMHDGEIEFDEALVHRLLESQFPRWAELPIAPVPSDGTANALYRLGPEMAIRLPRIESAVAQIHKEAEWLPRFAARLPLDVPVPLAIGEPGEGYPWPWAIATWLVGEEAHPGRIGDQTDAGRDMAAFVSALRSLDTAGGPRPSADNFWRGVPLRTRDRRVRECIAQAADLVDAPAVTNAWERSLAAPEWTGPPTWFHGDLLPGNLIAVDGRIRGVIDFGGLGVGDPACDLLVAWAVLGSAARGVFREGLAVDDASWERGRGWAVSVAMMGIPYYRHTNPGWNRMALHMLNEVLTNPAE